MGGCNKPLTKKFKSGASCTVFSKHESLVETTKLMLNFVLNVETISDIIKIKCCTYKWYNFPL